MHVASYRGRVDPSLSGRRFDRPSDHVHIRRAGHRGHADLSCQIGARHRRSVATRGSGVRHWAVQPYAGSSGILWLVMRRLIVLVHSPLVGPTSWHSVADDLRRKDCAVLVPSLLAAVDGEPPLWRRCVEAAAEAVDATGEADALVLVGHSGAGILLPVIAAELGLGEVTFLFVDAAVPPEQGVTVAADGWFREFLDRLPQRAGRLPPWSEWWGEGVIDNLISDGVLREQAMSEMRRLPFGYFTAPIPVPAGWATKPAAYLQLSDLFSDEADRAEQRGWPVLRIRGHHLQMLEDPAGTSAALLSLLDTLAER